MIVGSFLHPDSCGDGTLGELQAGFISDKLDLELYRGKLYSIASRVKQQGPYREANGSKFVQNPITNY